MRSGGVWSCLRHLLDAGEDSGLLSRALDAHAVKCGSAQPLVDLGAQVLRRCAEVALRQFGWKGGGAGLAHEAWYLTRDAGLACLFEALGLDGRLCNHREALNARVKADVVRAIFGEVEKTVATAGQATTAPRRQILNTSWHGDLQWNLAVALLELLPKRHMVLATDPAGHDAKLGWLLRSGSARAILERMSELHRPNDTFMRRQLQGTLSAELPKLCAMRLLVFVRLLHDLCRPVAYPSVDQTGDVSSLIAAIVDSISTSELVQLPYETHEQISDFRTSPLLNDSRRRALLVRLVPADSLQGRASSTERPEWPDPRQSSLASLARKLRQRSREAQQREVVEQASRSASPPMRPSSHLSFFDHNSSPLCSSDPAPSMKPTLRPVGAPVQGRVGPWSTPPGMQCVSKQDNVGRRFNAPSHNPMSAAALLSRPNSASDLGPSLIGPPSTSLHIRAPNSPVWSDMRSSLQNASSDAKLSCLEDHPVVTVAAQRFRHMLALLENDDDQQLCSLIENS